MENKDFEVFIPHANWKMSDKLIDILNGTALKYGDFVYSLSRIYTDMEPRDEILISRDYELNDSDDILFKRTWNMYGASTRKGFIANYGALFPKHTQILPIIKLSNKMFEEITKGLKPGTKTLELGRYPMKKNFLTTEEKKGKVPTGKTYTLPIETPDFCIRINKTQRVEEYDLNGEKIVDVVRYTKDIQKDKLLKVKETFTVKPLKWHIDWENKSLIAPAPLLTGIALSKEVDIPPYEHTYLYEYLNEIFLHDAILQHMNTRKLEEMDNIDQDEITTLINEISVYAEYYHGTEDVSTVVRKLVTKYNNDILELKNNTGLTLVTEDSLRIGLISDLNRILDKLKRNMESSKEYNKILDFIDKCIDALHGKETECDNELYKDIYRIHSEIFPKLTSDHKNQMVLRRKILTLLEEDKKDVKEYLEYINTLTDGINLRLAPPLLGYKDLTSYETHFRIKLHPVLESMVSMSKNEEKRIEIEAREFMLNELSKFSSNELFISTALMLINNGNYIHIDSNNRFIDRLLDSINEEVKSIRISRRDIDLKGILSIELESYDILSISKALSKIMISLHRINLDIEEEKAKDKKLNKYLVKI